jgi:hypothetical protein
MHIARLQPESRPLDLAMSLVHELPRHLHGERTIAPLVLGWRG